MKHPLFSASLLCLAMAIPAHAEPTIGFGASFSFGAGRSGETGLGLRVFTDNERDKIALSVGVDYMLNSNRIRPTVGAAYMGRNNYVGVDLGFGLNGEGVDFGLGLGGVRTQKPAVPAPAPIVEVGRVAF